MVDGQIVQSREYPIVAPGTHVATFIGIRMTKDDGTPFFSEKDNRKEFYCWAEFNVADKKLAGSLPLTGESGPIRITEKNKSMRFYKALLQRDIENDQVPNTDSLVGRQCIVSVEFRKAKDDSVKGSKIVEFTSLPKQEKQEAIPGSE